jgi:hypothetical protein
MGNALCAGSTNIKTLVEIALKKDDGKFTTLYTIMNNSKFYLKNKMYCGPKV